MKPRGPRSLLGSVAGFVMFGLVSSCSKADPAPRSPAQVLSQSRTALARRDRVLTTYRIEVETTQGDERAQHEFFFRSPNKSRGRVRSPDVLELLFDGSTFYRRLATEKALQAVPLEGTPAERALTLATLFTPFVPEGFRTPLLPLKGVQAEAVTGPDGASLARLRTWPEPGLEVSYLLRLPAADFLEKRTQREGHVRVLSMRQERCLSELSLCLPTQLEETEDGALLGTTRVTALEWNLELPDSVFAP